MQSDTINRLYWHLLIQREQQHLLKLIQIAKVTKPKWGYEPTTDWSSIICRRTLASPLPFVVNLTCIFHKISLIRHHHLRFSNPLTCIVYIYTVYIIYISLHIYLYFCLINVQYIVLRHRMYAHRITIDYGCNCHSWSALSMHNPLLITIYVYNVRLVSSC